MATTLVFEDNFNYDASLQGNGGVSTPVTAEQSGTTTSGYGTEYNTPHAIGSGADMTGAPLVRAQTKFGPAVYRSIYPGGQQIVNGALRGTPSADIFDTRYPGLVMLPAQMASAVYGGMRSTVPEHAEVPHLAFNSLGFDITVEFGGDLPLWHDHPSIQVRATTLFTPSNAIPGQAYPECYLHWQRDYIVLGMAMVEVPDINDIGANVTAQASITASPSATVHSLLNTAQVSSLRIVFDRTTLKAYVNGMEFCNVSVGSLFDFYDGIAFNWNMFGFNTGSPYRTNSKNPTIDYLSMSAIDLMGAFSGNGAGLVKYTQGSTMTYGVVGYAPDPVTPSETPVNIDPQISSRTLVLSEDGKMYWVYADGTTTEVGDWTGPSNWLG